MHLTLATTIESIPLSGYRPSNKTFTHFPEYYHSRYQDHCFASQQSVGFKGPMHLFIPTHKHCSSCLQAAFHTAASFVHPFVQLVHLIELSPYTFTTHSTRMRAKFVNCAFTTSLLNIIIPHSVNEILSSNYFPPISIIINFFR